MKIKRIFGIIELVWLIIFVPYFSAMFVPRDAMWVIIFLAPFLIFHAILLILNK